MMNLPYDAELHEQLKDLAMPYQGTGPHRRRKSSRYATVSPSAAKADSEQASYRSGEPLRTRNQMRLFPHTERLKGPLQIRAARKGFRVPKMLSG
jgi:hypothetical protein